MRIIFFISSLILIASCKPDMGNSHGAIILGDSSTIITETDSVFLEDYVSDINLPPATPTTDATEQVDTATAIAKKSDTVRTPVKTVVKPVSGKGLKVDFDEVTVFIPNIETKSFSNQNVKKLNGVSYQFVSGSLQSLQLITQGTTVNRVSQRHVTTIVATRAGKKMELENMDYASGWTSLKGSNNKYPITGLEAAKLSYKKTNIANIRTAVSRTARANRYSRSEIKEWENSFKNIKSVNQPPLSVVLQSVMWRIEGKDAKGKTFLKEVRLDMPM